MKRRKMGSFYVDCEVANLRNAKRCIAAAKMLVDTGAEYTWVPATVLRGLGIQPVKKDLVFQMANGQTITRSIGFAFLRSGEFFTVDEVVFGEPGDLTLLGARTLEGFGALVASGPHPAAPAHRVRGGRRPRRDHAAVLDERDRRIYDTNLLVDRTSRSLARSSRSARMRFLFVDPRLRYPLLSARTSR